MLRSLNSAVRLAIEKDRMDIWRLILQSHNESGMFPLAPEKIDWWLTRVLQPEHIPPTDLGPRGAIGVIGPIGGVEGMAMVVFSNFWYTNERHLEELMVFVEPEHRASNHAKALLHWMKEQSKQIGLPLLTGIISNKRTESKVRLYERNFPKVGAYFLYNPLSDKGVSSHA